LFNLLHNEWANRLRERLLLLPGTQKQRIVYLNDFLLSACSLWAAFSLRLSELFIPATPSEWLMFLSAPPLAVLSLRFAGAYRRVIRFSGNTSSRRIMTGISLGVLSWMLLEYLVQTDFRASYGVPRSVVLIYWALLFMFTWLNRELASWFLGFSSVRFVESEKRAPDAEKNVVIWGYGATALRLAHDLRTMDGAAHLRYRVIGIIDADETLWFRKADSVKVYPPEHLPHLIAREQVSEIYFDNEVIPRGRRLDIIKDLSHFKLTFRLLPSVEDIMRGTIAVDSIPTIKVEDLLGRDPVPPRQDLLERSVRGKSVMITGAGGSIGSELVRQIAQLQPSRLVLFEVSEAALYQIHTELLDTLRKLRSNGTEGPPLHVEATIGSVLNEDMMHRIMKQQQVNVIFHAAAYKHVPIVEHNPVAGLENNSLGTWAIARAARDCGVERFVFISTDKAVRPTNIMGASKRLAEKVLQAMAAEPDCPTQFCMVRFGNVLDSSGSVVPLFRKQIRDGGPVTVTHPDITRYFMLISEAVQLVIQAGAMSQQGAVYVLDMGEPVRINDLARSMINLAGLSVRDGLNPEGDIAIEYVGLRPGEKLYEELLLSGKTRPTQHERIRLLDEPFVPINELTDQLAYLENAMKDEDVGRIKRILAELVEGFHEECCDSVNAGDDEPATRAGAVAPSHAAG
jgi:FlaA1/EpsC-like NDP-sugar epimerase